MVTEAFNVRGNQRLSELQQYLKTNMPSATCTQSVERCSEEDLVEVTVHYKFSDIEKMESLQEKWRRMDLTGARQRKKSVLQRFFL